ncbi:hybrid sensor histidine kinase/response regulator [Vibrio sp. V39_P1S14PM300]|uniref:hybrid sensor histidine kinase/response regulator n=1 Tax=Vibrio sp. V39_P1S14PM300 TaxID=1938690 RepID=UPI00137351A0|nr:hybrid sensor histidine kinase/response regulator [Vibrio sp. V39_P1S14PM300]NAX22017.1 response regulator [Vibrio sp. V39_P1S14PM300]
MLDILPFVSMLNPKSVTLLTVIAIILVWLGYYCLKLKQKGEAVFGSYHLPYIAYSVCIVFWILSNCYFHTDLLVTSGKTMGIYMARFANLASYFAFAFAFYFTCSLTAMQQKRPIYTWQKLVFFGFSGYSLYINVFTDLTVQDITVYAPSQFALAFGPQTSLFFTVVFALVVLTLVNLLTMRGDGSRLRLTRRNYMIAGILIFMFSTAAIHMGVTYFFDDFSLTWLPPALSISEMLFVGYALITSRFYSSKYLFFLALTTTVTSVLYLLPLSVALDYSFYQFELIVLYTAILGLTWQRVFNSVKKYTSLMVYNSPLPPTEQIYSLVEEFQSSPSQAIQKLAKLLNVPSSKMQLVKSSPDAELYTDYLSENHEALVFEEIEDKLDNAMSQDALAALHHKMSQNDAAIVMPLFDSGHMISHLLISTHKQDGRLFSNEEVVALEKVLKQVQGYINSDRRIRQSQALANSIAHEMRNPLTQLQLHLETLQIQAQTHAEPDVLIGEIEKGKAAIRRGKQLIDIILREVSNSSLDQEPMMISSIKRLLLQAMNQYGFESDQIKNRVQLNVDKDFSVRVNDTLFNFVVFNLLRNAIYYFDSYPESQIEISTRASFHENLVIFRDTGPGIPEDIRTQIFDDFFSHNKSGGSGLGLGYCQRVMSSFGGSIQCHSKYGQYTEFHLIFPTLSVEGPTYDEPLTTKTVAPSMSSIAQSLHMNSVTQNVPQADKTILVVDDKEVQRALVKLYLEQLGFDVIQANNGKIAVDIFQNNPIDLVIMDIQMPVMNGFEAATKIKQLSPTTPVIALSGESGNRELELINSLMDGRLSKPTNKADLAAILNQSLFASRSPVA